MQMLNLHKLKNKTKKSQLILIGSLLIFIGTIALSWNYLLKIRESVYSEMLISMSDVPNEVSNEEIADDAVVGDNNTVYNSGSIDYSKYLGVLEIPKIGLKRGFYGVGSKYNDIKYNVSIVNGSSLPDEVNGNTILMAHSGDAYISFFAFLYKLNIGDKAYVSYNGTKYTYRIVNIYNVPKIGVVSVKRNKYKTCLTLITCTKDSDTEQTIYILERD